MDIKQASILVVDDNDSMRRLLRLMLRDLGARDVLLAATVDEAFAILAAKGVDVILTDWEMDGETGMHLLQRLRLSSDGRLRRLPVVMMTAYAESWRVASARDAGVTEFLVKPLSPAQVTAKLRAALLHSRAAATNENQAASRNQTGGDDGLADAGLTYARLRSEFERSASEAAHQIALDARNMRLKPELAAEIAQRIYRVAHNIKGQGSSFDYPLATEIAAELCRFLHQLAAQAGKVSERDLAVISGHGAALDAIARNKVTGSGGELGQRILTRLRGFVAA